MAMSKKNSRTIMVANETYKWTISPNSGYVVLVVELEMGVGRRIEVYINSDINDFWANFPHINNLDLKVIKPGDVKNIIIQALKDGWGPKEKGKPLIFDLVSEKINRRL
ncbi:hypothetical protein SAMN05444162_3534 [Paenibacillaceae bacterium GAS479]|nr:hypothetical protein SAMN05444162_3534 [Paenibacillaceae bacterium GAS479]